MEEYPFTPNDQGKNVTTLQASFVITQRRFDYLQSEWQETVRIARIGRNPDSTESDQTFQEYLNFLFSDSVEHNLDEYPQWSEEGDDEEEEEE